ncbi:hypothetical protein BCR44DRAFT_1312441 [Catenaria anguillulae PL171]|uniref:Uncharacterized protein n=1 Tax=Catenaria anguillulae PL171 TaxID=765915 RepID=A0A1Y2H7F0_9FUNG|nr:hypothetical protein BCR44DRAFT_1312441 [Catenaria anguillulae PL171]
MKSNAGHLSVYWLLDMSCIEYRSVQRHCHGAKCVNDWVNEHLHNADSMAEISARNSPRYRPHSTAFPIPIWSNTGCVTP